MSDTRSHPPILKLRNIRRRFQLGETSIDALNSISLDIHDADRTLRGELKFDGIVPWPVTLTSPGIMGPYAFAPFMECYHGVLGFDHTVRGSLVMNGATVNFDGGRGYIEKDWGKSMPKSWVWFQSNHFQPDNVSISVNIANVPFLKCSFLGFIIVFRYKDRIFMFTTYNGSWIKMLYYNKNKLRITTRNCRFRLDISITYAEGGTIIAPVKGQMCRNIMESTNAVVKLRFSDRKGNVLYQGIGTNGGLEIVEE